MNQSGSLAEGYYSPNNRDWVLEGIGGVLVTAQGGVSQKIDPHTIVELLRTDKTGMTLRTRWCYFPEDRPEGRLSETLPAEADRFLKTLQKVLPEGVPTELRIVITEAARRNLIRLLEALEPEARELRERKT